MNYLINWINQIVLDYPEKNTHKQVRIILHSSLLTAVFMALYGVMGIFIDFKLGIVIQVLLTLLFFSIPWAIKRKMNIYLIANLFVLLGCAGITTMTWFTGGLESPILPWLALVPIVALFFVNRIWAWIWTGITLCIIILLIYLQNRGYYFQYEYDRSTKTLFYGSCMLGLVLTYLLLNLIYEFSLRKANQELILKNVQIEEINKVLSQQALKISIQRDEIILEKQKSDILLLNILPAEVADELKKHGISEARQYENVTILFTDFVNFTGLSEILPPKELVARLHHHFQAFDSIIEKYGLEKIKTIGDAYMAVCGLPHADAAHAENVILAAKEIQEYLSKINLNLFGQDKSLNGLDFQARVGVHSGSVVAGIVGSKKFVYDIWGDAVNIAARIEQSGEAGKINISGVTYELVKDKFKCFYRGKIVAKNKGLLDMYFVE